MSYKPEGKPWVVLSVSVYDIDAARLERLVRVTKLSGESRASKSSVIRDALEHYEQCLGLEGKD